MDMRAWHYFLTLERDFAATTAYVEPDEANFGTYSDRFAGLLLLIGSEVDVVAKAICESLDPDAKRFNMKDCSKVILEHYPAMHGVLVQLPQYRLTTTPFEEWGAENPDVTEWWDAYNKVKHDRLASRERANQRSVFRALSGLLVLNLYYYAAIEWPQPFPVMLQCGFPELLMSREGARRVPGI